jgi:hypothetical protein
LIGAAASLGQAITGGSSDAKDVREFYERIAGEAPAEIRSDTQVLADAYSDMIQAFEDLGLEPGETPTASDAARYQQLSPRSARPRWRPQGRRISTWTDESCSGG